MIWKDQRIGQHDVFSPSSSKHYDLGDVVGRERLAPLVHGVGLGFVAVEADD
jgi:hypothetical protein